MASKNWEIIAICYILHFECTDVANSYEWIGWGCISKIPNLQNIVKAGNKKLPSVSYQIHTKTEINDCAEVQKQKLIHAAMKT